MKRTLLCMLLYSGLMQAQQFTEKQVLTKLNNVYREAASYTMKVEMRVYEKETDKLPVQSWNGSMAKSGQHYFSEMMGRTTLSNARCHLLVDDMQKRIFYSKALKKEKLPGQETSLEAQLDTLLKYYTSIRFGAGTPTNYLIEITPGKHDQYYSSISLVINKSTFALEEMTCIYKEQDDLPYKKVVISYRSIALNQPVGEQLFSETRFVSLSKGKVIPAGAYTSYMLIDKNALKK